MLELAGVTSGYGALTVVRDVSLRVAPGELVTLVGANGAGKTTLLRTVSGLLPLRKGQITFDGRELGGLTPDRIVELGVAHVPQGREVFPELSVRKNVALGAYRRRGRSDRAAVAEDLEEVLGLFPILGTRGGQLASALSGGQQQMLAIARALMSRPRLLLLDEPSMGLAPIVVKEIFQHIARLRDRGLTMLLVEQNARLALAVADRVYALRNGVVAMSGAAADVGADAALRKAYLGAGS